MKNTICSAPWQATYYKESMGKYKMCCSFKKWTKAESPEDYYNSPVVESVREKMLNGEWHEGCTLCHKLENAGLESDRETFNKHLEVDKLDTSKFELKWLDYRPGNLCNLKCRMCHSSNSSLIDKETKKHPELKKFMETIPDYESELLPSICNDETFRDLEVLKILGGEPTIDPQVQKLLDWTISNGYAKNINLRYTTNATNINENWIKAVKQFKTTKIQLSLDGTGKTYDYIRTGANWHKIKENIMLMPKKINNIRNIGSNIVFSVYDCFTIDQWYPELLEIKETMQREYGIDINFNIIDCTWPTYQMVSNLPEEYKQIVVDKIDSMPMDKVLKAVRHHTTKKAKGIPEKEVAMFFEHNDMLDRIRKTNINDISEHYETLRQNTL
tara:strand:+ start:2318 stop:3475 length:1158 start_codon:yes stop_codon:yes gene_type:complete